MIRIVLTDDHPTLLEGLQRLIGSAEGMEVIGAYTNGQELLESESLDEADVLLLDVQMKEMSGMEVLTALQARLDQLKVIVLSAFNKPGVIKSMLKNGASGFLLKNTPGTEVIASIRKVMAGESVISPELTSKIVEDMRERPNLSSREMEVVRLIAQDLSTVQIADKMHVSSNTVESHKRNIFRKLKIKTSIGLVRYAYDQGWIDCP